MNDITVRVVPAPVVKLPDRVEISLSLGDAHILRELLGFTGTIPSAIKGCKDYEIFSFPTEFQALMNNDALSAWMAQFRRVLSLI